VAIYPVALQKLIAPGSNDPGIIPVGMVLHVAAMEGDSLHDFFATRSGGIESHFYIRYTGVVEQYRNTDHEADANLNGNSFVKDGKVCGLLSVETEGLGDGSWTDEQIESLKKLMLWVHETHNVPLQVCPTWMGPGFGYHIMFGSPGPWTPSVKSCPGPKRIIQFKNVLTPWMNQGGQAPGDDMPSVQDLLGAPVGKREGQTVDGALAASYRTEDKVDRLLALVKSSFDDVADDIAAVEAGTASKEQAQRLAKRIRAIRDAVAAQAPGA